MVRIRLQLASTRFLNHLSREDTDTPHQHMCPACKQWWTCTRMYHDVPRHEPTRCESCVAAQRAMITKYAKEMLR